MTFKLVHRKLSYLGTSDDSWADNVCFVVNSSAFSLGSIFSQFVSIHSHLRGMAIDKWQMGLIFGFGRLTVIIWFGLVRF